MIDELLRELGWYRYPNSHYIQSKAFGEFSIEGGSFVPPLSIQDKQYFRIVGSVFNDGVYQHPVADLTDEVFDGAVWALRIPPAVIALAAKIKAWCESDAAKVGAYSSESYPNGYSYTRAVGEDGIALRWQDVFANELSQWRMA